jgi:hypothetical protein
MIRLRWWTFGLVLQLALFYNFERLHIDQGVAVNIEPYSYALVMVAVLATLAVPAFSQAPVRTALAGWAVVYVAGHLILLPHVSLVGPDHVYTLFLELGMLILAVALATQVARALREFARAVEQLTIPDAERWVLEIRHAADTIRAEVNRSRRYQRPLSVLVVEPMLGTVCFTLERLFAEVQRGIARHYAIVNLARMLKITLRRTDVIALEDRIRGRFIVLCPETTTDGATILSDRIEVYAQRELGFSVTCGTAIFPDDALTFEDVVRVAVSRVGNPSQTDSPTTSDRATDNEPGITAEAN